MESHNFRSESEIQRKAGDLLRTDEISNGIKKRDQFTDALLNQQIEFHQTIFPNKTTKEILNYQTKLLKQRAEANLEGHRMLFEFQRQSVKTALDAVLIRGKQKVIKETNISFLDELESMSTQLMSIVNRNDKSLEAEFENLDKMKIPEMRDEKKKLLLALNGKFHIEMLELISRYQKIKDELV